MSEATIQKPLNGWWVFAAFAAFFGVVIAVNTVFITQALKSHSGVVTDDAYKKGLAFNDLLNEARHQPELNNEVIFKNGELLWVLKQPSGANIQNAQVTANFMRPVKDGDDFSLPMRYEGDGIYRIEPNFPYKGVWTLQLSATWDKKSYRTTTQIIVK